jgi:hypothetical protein
MINRIKLSIASDPRDVPLAEQVILGFASSRGVTPAESEAIAASVCRIIEWVNANAYGQLLTGEVQLELEAHHGGIACFIRDQGLPLESFGGQLGAVPDELSVLPAVVSHLSLANLAHLGKRLSITFPVADIRVDRSTPRATYLPDLSGAVGADDIEYRKARVEDAEGIAQLICSHYGMDYVHEDFYRPEWIEEQIESGSLISFIAVLDGQILGHQGLLGDSPRMVREAGAGIVHPAVRGARILTKLIPLVIQHMRELNEPAIMSHAVTSHPYAQRAAHSAGFHTVGIQLGFTPLGFDPPIDERVRIIRLEREAKRAATTISYLPLNATVKEVNFPSRYVVPLTEAYSALNVSHQSANIEKARHDLDDVAPVLRETISLGSNAITIITVTRWDEHPRDDLIEAILDGRAQSDPVYCDIDLASHTQAELDLIVELLRTYGFFYCGLVFLGQRSHDHIRLQSLLNPHKKAETDEIVLDGSFAHDLLQFILADRDR